MLRLPGPGPSVTGVTASDPMVRRRELGANLRTPPADRRQAPLWSNSRWTSPSLSVSWWPMGAVYWSSAALTCPPSSRRSSQRGGAGRIAEANRMGNEPPSVAAEQEVLAAAANLVAAFAASDAPRDFACFAPAASFVFHNVPQWLPDRASYQRRWKDWEGDGFRVEQCRSLEPRVTLAGPDTAVFTHCARTKLAGLVDGLVVTGNHRFPAFVSRWVACSPRASVPGPGPLFAADAGSRTTSTRRATANALSTEDRALGPGSAPRGAPLWRSPSAIGWRRPGSSVRSPPSPASAPTWPRNLDE